MFEKIKILFRSVYLRYMLSYAAIMLILFIAISIYMNNYYSNSIREEIIESNINTLSRIRYENEANISAAINTGNQVGLSPYISAFKFSEEPWKVYHLKKQIIPYTVTNEFFDKVFLIFDIDDYLYSSLTSIKLDLFLNQIMLYDDVSPEELEQQIRQHNGLKIYKSQNIKSSLLDGNNARMITFIVPIGGEQENTGSLIFLIEESAYVNLFEEEIYDEHNTYIIYENEVMVSRNSFEIPDEMIIEKLTENKGTLIEEIDYEGESYLLISLHGQQKNMQYTTVIPENTIAANLKSALLGFWLFMVGLSIPIIILILYLSQRNYKPISDIRHMLAEGNLNRDDFAVIKSGISSLVGENVDLVSRLEKSTSIRKSNFIKDFVKGRYKERKECESAANRLGIDINKQYYIVALISTSPETDSPDMIEELVGLKEEGTDGYGVEVIALEQMLFVLFSDDEAELNLWVNKVKQVCGEKNEEAVVAISALHHDEKSAANAYLEASAAFDNRFIMGSAHVLSFRDVCASSANVFKYSKNYMDILKKAMHSGDKDTVNKAIDDLFGYLTGLKISLFNFRLIYNEIISIILREHIRNQKDSESVDTLHLYDIFTLSNCSSINDLDDMLRKLCSEILSNKKSDAKNKYPVMEQIVGYMNENYADADMNISALADKFDVSSARLSLAFKELMGMGPAEYLMLLRIEKAKEMLSMTNMSVKDICIAVGYYDTSGFIRRFRKYMAVTPLQYRNSRNR